MSKPRGLAAKINILDAACELFRERGFEATTMREIADRAGMATGAAYYHFASKEELVFAYYLRLEEQSEEQAQLAIEEHPDALGRLLSALRFKFKQMEGEREIIRALARVAADPTSKLSPLAAGTKDIRTRAIAMLGRLLNDSDLKVGKDLKPVLPTIAWLYYMLMVFFWAHDRSGDHRHANRLLELTAPMLIRLLGLSALPLTGALNKSIAAAVHCAMEAADEPDEAAKS